MEVQKLKVGDNIILIEIEEKMGHGPASATGKKIKASFDDAKNVIKGFATEFIDMASKIEKQVRPNSISVKFGLKVDGDASWLVGRIGSEVNFEITLTWNQ